MMPTVNEKFSACGGLSASGRGKACMERACGGMKTRDGQESMQMTEQADT